MLDFKGYSNCVEWIEHDNREIDIVLKRSPNPNWRTDGDAFHLSFMHHDAAHYRSMIRNRYGLEHTIITQGIGL